MSQVMASLAEPAARQGHGPLVRSLLVLAAAQPWRARAAALAVPGLPSKPRSGHQQFQNKGTRRAPLPWIDFTCRIGV